LRRLLVLTVVLTALLVATDVALADHGDARPNCADIVNFDAGYTANVVTAVIGTAAPTCRTVTYSLVVIVDEGSTPQVYSRSGTESTEPFVIQSGTIEDDDANVCVYVMSSRGGRNGLAHTVDLLPDTGCVTLAEEGSGGGAGHA
jgi:hypothetical protein